VKARGDVNQGEETRNNRIRLDYKKETSKMDDSHTSLACAMPSKRRKEAPSKKGG